MTIADAYLPGEETKYQSWILTTLGMDRLRRLIPNFIYYHMTEVDLTNPDFVEEAWKGLYQYYENDAGQLAGRINGSGFWREVQESLKTRNELSKRGGYPLMNYDPGKIEFDKKPWESILNKSFRSNFVHPVGYPVTPSNWFTEYDDIVRTTIAVCYLSNVRDVSDLICELAPRFGWSVCPDYEANLIGYYAVHLRINSTLEVQTSSGPTNAMAEIQVCTQTQEALRRVTHKLYEYNRMQPGVAIDGNWMWEHDHKQFAPSYLGHVLQYVDAMIQREVDDDRS